VNRLTLSMALGLLAALALALPAGASAALPAGTVTTTDWDVRHSWVNYVTNPLWFGGLGQGTVTRTGGAASQTGYGATTWGAGYVNTQYGTRFAAASDSTSGGVRTIQLTGGLQFAVSTHSIDVRLSDIKVKKETSGRVHVVLDSYYDPISGSPVSTNDLDFADVVDVTGINNQLQLTSGGATVFNGGGNGSYSAGDEFGRLVFNP
jgi:Htaa